MAAVPLELRRGCGEDAAVLASLHLRSRAAAMPWLAVVHHEAETRGWMEHVVLAHQQVVVAERNGNGGAEPDCRYEWRGR